MTEAAQALGGCFYRTYHSLHISLYVVTEKDIQYFLLTLSAQVLKTCVVLQQGFQVLRLREGLQTLLQDRGSRTEP